MTRGSSKSGMIRYAVAFLLAASVAPPANTPAQETSAESQRVDSQFAQYTRGLSPGLAIAVRAGKVVLKRGYGYANLEHRIPITPATVFDVASVSKQFAGLRGVPARSIVGPVRTS